MSEMSLHSPLSLQGAAKIGRFWFRWRSLSPVPLFLLLFLLPPNFHLRGLGLIAVIGGIFLAESLRVWAVGCAGSATRTRGDSIPALVCAGPYRYVRNPLYVANILLYTLCGVLFGFVYLSVGIFVFSCIQYIFIVAFEEEMLARTFGPPYKKYQQEVPRWWGSLSPRCSPSDHAFDLTRALRSERSTFYSIGAMLVLFLIKSFVR